MKRACLLASVAVGCGGGPFQPWHTFATISTSKPASPLRAPADGALVVTILHTPQGEGNGGYTIFDEAHNVIAQFGEPMKGWSVTPIAPGARRIYLRTWTSDFCMRLDVTVAAGKVYMLSVSNDVFSDGDFRAVTHIPRAGFVYPDPGKPAPAGPLLMYPFVEVDLRKARAELEAHGSQLAACVASADKSGPLRAPDVGFGEIDFTVSSH